MFGFCSGFKVAVSKSESDCVAAKKGQGVDEWIAGGRGRRFQQMTT